MANPEELFEVIWPDARVILIHNDREGAGTGLLITVVEIIDEPGRWTKSR